MGPDSRPQRRDGVLAQAAGDTVVLLDSRSGEYFTLNEVGGRIWELLDGDLTVEQIAGVLAGEYDAPADVIAGDAAEVIGELRKADLVVDEAAAA